MPRGRLRKSDMEDDEDFKHEIQPTHKEVTTRTREVNLSVDPSQLTVLLELGELDEYKELLLKLVFEADTLGVTTFDISERLGITIPKVREILKEAKSENLRRLGGNLLAGTVSNIIAQQEITTNMALRDANTAIDPMVKAMSLKSTIESQANLLKSLTPSTGLTSIIESAADNEDHKTMSNFKNDIMSAVTALSDKVEELKAQEDIIDVEVDETGLDT
jgi:hypothetical protein